MSGSPSPSTPNLSDEDVVLLLDHDCAYLGPGLFDDIAERLGLSKDPHNQPSALAQQSSDPTGELPSCLNRDIPSHPGLSDDDVPLLLDHECAWIDEVAEDLGPGSLHDIAERLGLSKDPPNQPSDRYFTDAGFHGQLTNSPNDHNATRELPSCLNRDIPSHPGLSIHNSITPQGLDTTAGELQQPRDPTQLCNPYLNQPNAFPQQCLETTGDIPIWGNEDRECITREIQSTARELQLYNQKPMDERSGVCLPSTFNQLPDGSAPNTPNWNGVSSSGAVQFYNQEVEEENFLRWFHATHNQPTKGRKEAAVGNKDSGGGSLWSKDPMGFCSRYLTDDDFRVWFHSFLNQSYAHSQHTSDATGNLYPSQMGFSVNKAPAQPDVPPKQHLNTTGVDEGTNEDSAAIQVKRTLVEQRQFTKNLKLSDIRAYFHLTMEKASDELAIGTTALQTACRRLGLKRWPQKELLKIQTKIDHLENKLANGGHSNDDVIRREILKLREKEENIIGGSEQKQSHLTDVTPDQRA